MNAQRTTLSFTLGNESSLVCNDFIKLKTCHNCMMSHCLPEGNNVRKPFSLLYLGVFWIMDNMYLLWICIIYLCLKRNTSFSISNPIKIISVINRIINISRGSMVVSWVCIVDFF